MNTRVNCKFFLVSAAVFAMMIPVSTASAQDVTESDRATTDEILDSAGDRLDAEAGEEEERDVETRLEDEADVDLADYEAEERGLTPEELDEKRQRLEEASADQIDRFENLIENDPQADDRPDWMFEKAELVWQLRNMEYIRERNEYNACMDAVFDGSLEEDECDEPEPDYSEPQAIYNEILREYPDYSRLDEVLFRLGSGLLDADKGPQAVVKLNRLIDEYPNSIYVPDARLALGDFYFEQHQTEIAKTNYVEVLEYPDYQNYDYALYQLGWTNYNRGDGHFRASADRFKQVIEREDDATAWGLLADRAANDLMLPLAEIPDGWKEARDYFTEMRDIEFAYEQLQEMAMHLEAQGNFNDAIAVYDWLMDEQPDHKDVPDWMDATVRAVRDIDFDRYEQRVVEYVDYLHPDHTWYRQNEGEERALQDADQFVESNLSRLGTHYHRAAQEADEEGAADEEIIAKYQQASEYYQQFIDRFPRHHASFDMTFFLGQIYLHNLEQFADAATQYQHVVDLYVDDNVPDGVDEGELDALVRDAAYNIVVAYNNLVREHHPESVLVDMAERAGEDPDMTTEGIDEITDEEGEPDVPEREDLLKWEEGFVQASDQFAEMYPEDDITPTVDYVAAEVYRDRGHFDSCISRYENIIEYAPNHEYASFAGNSLLEANYRLENWDDVEHWARHLKEHEIFDVTPRDSLTNAIAFAINSRAIEYMDEDKELKGAEELLRLAEEFPEHELASGALFNAAIFYDEGDEVSQAATLFERIVDEYDDSEEAPRSLVELGQIYQARTDFERAANYFARLGEEDYRDYRDYRVADVDEDEVDFETIHARDAVFNAASLREAMEEWDDAIATYEQYLEYFGDEIDDQQEIEYHLAYLEQERDDWEASRDRLETYLDSYGDDVPLYELVETHTELGLIAERLEVDDYQEVADEHFSESVELWNDEERWAEAFGEEGEAKRLAMRDEASQALFHQSEYIFEDFQAVELTFPPDELAETATEKAEIQQEAEQMYDTIIGMESPKWVSAAAFRRGQTYRDFADDLMNLEIPDDVPEEMHFEYEMSVDDLVGPLVEQSLDAFRAALNLALQFEAYNEWSARSAAEISDLESGIYPITGQEGVDVEHNRVDFFAPAPVTSFEVVRERGIDRYERLRPEEPDPTLEPGHPHYDPRLDRDSPEFDPQYKRELLGPDEEDEQPDDAAPQAGVRGFSH